MRSMTINVKIIYPVLFVMLLFIHYTHVINHVGIYMFAHLFAYAYMANTLRKPRTGWITKLQS